MCDRAGLGSEPRRILDELGEIRVMDVILPTRAGIEIRKRCSPNPTTTNRFFSTASTSGYLKQTKQKCSDDFAPLALENTVPP